MLEMAKGFRLENPTSRGRYWKVERPDSHWNWIPDTSRALAAATEAGAMYVTWVSFSHEPGEAREEPTRYGDLPLDFDHKTDPGQALEDLRRLCLFYLPEKFGIDPWGLRFYCSGGKGFHAEIPARNFGLDGGYPELPRIYRKIVQSWVDELQLHTLDLSMYAMGKGKMFRIANVRRSNGRYKVPVSRDDVAYASLEDLLLMSESPQNV